MAVGIYGAVAERTTEVAADTSTDITLGATPIDDDIIILYIARSTGSSTASHTDASCPGFTLLTSYEPLSSFKCWVDILWKVASSDGATHTVTQAVAGENTSLRGGWIFSGAAGETPTASTFNHQGSGTTHTYPADGHTAGGMTVHMMFTQLNLTLNTVFPSGDTSVLWAGSGSGQYRQGGFAISGGSTVSGTHTSPANVTWGNVWINEGGTDVAAVVDTVDIAEAEVMDPARDYSTTGIDVDVTGTNNVDQVEGELTRDSDGFYWNDGVGWQAGASTTVESFTSTATPFTRNYTSLPADTDMTEGGGYAFRVRARDATLTEFGLWATRNFDVGTWEYATDVLVTADVDNVLPGGSVTAPTENQRLANSTTAGTTILGTATDGDGTVSTVTVRIDAGSYTAATNTGTNFSTWSWATGALALGAHVVDVRITDNLGGITDLQRNFVVNDVPTCAISTPSASERFISSTTSQSVTGTSTDELLVTNVEVRWQTDGGGFGSWFTATNTGTNFSTWSYSITGLSGGEEIDVEARSTDGEGDVSTSATRKFFVNGRPAVGGVAGITEAQVFTANAAMPTFTATSVTDDFGNIDSYRFRLQRDSDSFFWNDATPAWQAGTVWNPSSSGQNDATPASHNFEDGIDGIELPQDLGESIGYTLEVAALDADAEWGDAYTRTFSTGAVLPVCTITSPTDGQRDPSGTTDIVMSGTASSSLGINKVEVSKDGGLSWFNATGTLNWTHTFASAATDGDTFDLRARSTDTDLTLSPEDTAGYAVNAKPTITNVTGITEAQAFAANDPMPTFTVAGVNDDFGNIDQYRFRLQRDSDTFWWNDATPAWQAGTVWNPSSSGQNDPTPASYAFTDAVDGIELPQDLGVGVGYTLGVAALDVDSEWSNTYTRTFSANTLTPTVTIDQTGNHPHGDAITGTATGNGGATVTGVTVSAASGTPVAATNTGTSFSTWSIDPTLLDNWPLAHQLDGNNDPITMSATLIDVVATDDNTDTGTDSVTLTPTLPAPTVALTDDRLLTGNMSDSSVTEIRIERNFTNGGAVNEMWNGATWVADDASWLLMSTDELATTFNYTEPTWLASDDTTTDKDVYVITVRARNQTSTVTDSATLDTDWPTVVYDSPADAFEYTSDPVTVNAQLTATDASALAATIDMQVARVITAGGATMYLQPDLTTWNVSQQTIPVAHAAGVATVAVPVAPGYTYTWGLLSAADTHGNTTTDTTYPHQTFSVESQITTSNDPGWTTPQATLVEIDVLANDVGLQSDVVLTIETAPTSGAAVVTGTGLASRIEYTPTLTYNGAVSFTYRATNGDGGTGVGTTSGYVGLTPPEVDAGLFGGTTNITRRVDLYENPTGVTLYEADVPVIDGNVTVDANRSERRRADISIYNDGNYDAIETELWYDKIIKINRGVVIDGSEWLYPIFTGKIESRSIQHVGNEIKLSCRDMSIVLAQEFGVFEEYAGNLQVETVIEGIALAGGLPAGSMNLAVTGVDIGPTELVYEPSAKRWDTMRQLAESNELDLFFDAEGVLQIRDFPREVGQGISHVFQTGVDSNIGAYTMKTSPTNIFNVVAVVGDKTSNDVSYYGVAENTDPTSPTRIDKIGRRPITISRPEITSNAHAQSVAELLLEDYSKESFSISSAVIPDPRWEANVIVEFPRLNPEIGETTRYVLESFSLGLKPGPASIEISRMKS